MRGLTTLVATLLLRGLCLCKEVEAVKINQPVHKQVSERAKETVVFDFDGAVKNFVENESKHNKVPVTWWDMHGEHVHLREYAYKYKTYKVTATAGNVDYGTETSKRNEPNVVHTQVVKNEQSQSQKVTVSRTVVHKKTASWTTETAFRSSFSVKASASIKEIVTLESQLEIGLDYRSGRGEVHTESETFTLQQEVTVPPNKTVRIQWIVTDTVTTVPWTAPVTVEGWIAVWYESRVKGHHLWFYSITWVWDPFLKRLGPNKAQFTATGMYRAVNAHESHLHVTESDLLQERSGKSDANAYDIPLNLTILRNAAES
uniref:Putative cytotoxin-like protein n=1 Tax=Ixodes ricinus TaxID=34613 RepID=A0A0K8RED0_IXORI